MFSHFRPRDVSQKIFSFKCLTVILTYIMTVFTLETEHPSETDFRLDYPSQMDNPSLV